MRVRYTREGAVTRAHVIPDDESLAGRAMVEGFGETRLSPTDHDMPWVGRAIACARAIQDMGRELESVYQERTITKTRHDALRIARGAKPVYHREEDGWDTGLSPDGRTYDIVIPLGMLDESSSLEAVLTVPTGEFGVAFLEAFEELSPGSRGAWGFRKK